jgi:altronate dehydratase
LDYLAAINCIVFNPEDNVGVLVSSGGEPNQIVQISGPSAPFIKLKSSVPKGHKIAIREIKPNEEIIKFGQVIGISNKTILPGEHVHVHNISSANVVDFSAKYPPKKILIRKEDFSNTFRGFLRSDGRAGVRNYILVASTVNCSATVAKKIANYFKSVDLSKQGIDGIVPITHLGGCAQAIGSYAQTILNRTITGWLDHPNVVGAVVVGLGCETSSLESILKNSGTANKLSKNFLESFNIQDAGGTKKSISLGIDKVQRILSRLPVFQRTELPVSLLTVALNCGGSDAYSALTANPALGMAGDVLVHYGGTVVLAEIPECYGAEKLLIQRCASEEDRDKLAKIFSWWVEYARKNNVTMNDNLSSGNIAGGISTILEKSLGAVAKSGDSPVNQVVDYAEHITKKGVIIMNTPGFDPVSVTGLVAGGCNLVAFTTGRGSVYGCSIVPTIKIASNPDLYERLKDDMDIDAGKALTQNNISEVAGEIYKFLKKVADGTQTCSEKNGLGEEEFAPWQVGETL